MCMNPALNSYKSPGYTVLDINLCSLAMHVKNTTCINVGHRAAVSISTRLHTSLHYCWTLTSSHYITLIIISVDDKALKVVYSLFKHSDYAFPKDNNQMRSITITKTSRITKNTDMSRLNRQSNN